MPRLQGSTDFTKLNDEEKKQCFKWEFCTHVNNDCLYAYQIKENEPKRCRILSDTNFVKSNGEKYNCPFYK